jgi:hypothetical protein
MSRKKKISLIGLIWLLTILIVLIVQVSPIAISTTLATFFQIPAFFWIILILSPFLLYIIAKDSEKPLVPLFCVVIYYFIFYSYGLFFASHPTLSDVNSSAEVQEILSSIIHIGSREISIEQYFQWPIFFIFSKIFTCILGIGPIQTLNLGFFSLFLPLPFFLSIFYKRENQIKSSILYFILPALYLILAFHYINDQFVPQFLALIYLVILFGFYVRYEKDRNVVFFVLVIIYFALTVFTHPFLFVFFLFAIVINGIMGKKKRKIMTIHWEMVLIFISIISFYLYFYIAYIKNVISWESQTSGETWWFFEKMFSERTQTVADSGYTPQFLYHLVPEIYDAILTPIAKIIVFMPFFIVGIIFLLYIIKKRRFFDFSIIVGAVFWFGLGMIKEVVLGQRAIQIACLPLARHFVSSNRLLSFLSKIIIVMIIIAPSVFVANTLINESVTGEDLTQDNQENIAGRFLDSHINNEAYLLKAHNLYPTGINSGVIPAYDPQNSDFVLNSPKLRLRFMYFNVPLPISHQDSVVYNSKSFDRISICGIGK